MIVIAIILILAAIEIPNLLRARMAASQAAAVASIRTIEAAEITYAVTYGQGYSPTLSALGSPPADAQVSSKTAGLIDNLLASGVKGGYQYIYIPGPVIDGKIDTYTLKAVPAMPCATGNAYYTLEPASGPSVLTQTFGNSIQADLIAHVLGETLGSGATRCGGAGP